MAEAEAVAEFVMISPATAYPSVADGRAMLDEMKRMSDQERRFVIGSNCKPEYIAAALAIEKSLFRKDSGEPNYTAAARHYLQEGETGSSGRQVSGSIASLCLLASC